MNAQLAAQPNPFGLKRVGVPIRSIDRPPARAIVLGHSVSTACRVVGWVTAACLLLGAGYVLGFVTVLFAISWTLGSEGAFEGFIASGGLLMVCVWSGLWCWNAPVGRRL
ncbi:MAG TPA: hypothetical protein VGO90_07705 [Chthoniobacteraceae bacterium]|nr:hypothetical protein [Chthoniobacteraceae bacterium]